MLGQLKHLLSAARGPCAGKTVALITNPCSSNSLQEALPALGDAISVGSRHARLIWDGHMIRASAALALILALASGGPAQADYPDKPVRVVVPVAAGGGVDVMARLLAQKLSERLGQQFVVENRAGAAGVIGTKAVIASPNDGTTLLYTPSSLSLTVAVHKTPPYDVAKDLTPIVNVAVSPYALVVHPSLPVRDLKEFIAYAKANPGKLSYSSAGVGSASHLAGDLLKTMAGIEMVHVPNKGMNPALIDLMGGQVQALFASVPGMSGALGTAASHRHGGTKAIGIAAGPADDGRAGSQGVRGRQLGRIARARGPRSRDREEAPWRDHRHPRHRRRQRTHQDARLRRDRKHAGGFRQAGEERRGALERSRQARQRADELA